MMRKFILILSAIMVGAWACAAGDGTATHAVPKGTLAKYTFEGSAIFPGTTREYSIYVPAQYDGAKPACGCCGSRNNVC